MANFTAQTILRKAISLDFTAKNYRSLCLFHVGDAAGDSPRVRCRTCSWLRTRAYCEKMSGPSARRGFTSSLPVDLVLFRFYFSNVFRTPPVPSKVRAHATTRRGPFGTQSVTIISVATTPISFPLSLSLFLTLFLSSCVCVCVYTHTQRASTISSQLIARLDTCPCATS